MKRKSIVAVAAFAAAALFSDVAFAACYLFEDRDYGGARFKIGNGWTVKMVNGERRCSTTSDVGPNGESETSCEKIKYSPDWNDAVSSFKVDAGCTLTLHQHVNEGGAHFIRSNNVKYVGTAWNDEASEASCSCGG
jgi:syncollin